MSGTDVTVSNEGSLQIIKFNRPEKRNALNLQCYLIIKDALNHAAENKDIKVTLITGEGDYFSSGNDFSAAPAPSDEDMDLAVRRRMIPVREFIRTLIDHPKIVIALVNGPAIGVAVTMLALCDLVYALDTATFQTPFTSLGISAEGCSTYTFPLSLGKSMAARMLYFNYKMTAKEAKDCGFVGEIYKRNQVPDLITEIRKLAELPLKSLMCTKKMVRSHQIRELHFANAIELDNLIELLQSEDFMTAIVNTFMKKKNKL